MKDKIDSLIKKALELNNADIDLTHSQKAALYAAARAHSKNPARRRFLDILSINRRVILWGTGIAACIALLTTFVYHKGKSAAAEQARMEIARLQEQLEQSRLLREEFARIIRTQDMEFLQNIPNSEINLNAALIVAEEKYVRDIDGFRELIRSKHKENGGSL